MADLDTLRPEVADAVSALDETTCMTNPGLKWYATIRAELLRLTDENARLLAANRDAMDHFEQMQAELAESRETIKRLNRRVQVAEAGVAEKVKASGGSLGRALANAAADMYMRERDEAQAELAALKARIAGSVELTVGDPAWSDGTLADMDGKRVRLVVED